MPKNMIGFQKPDLTAVNWNEPNWMIAERFGLTAKYVSALRHKTTRAPKVRFATVKGQQALLLDWRKSDSELAKETGRSRKSLWRTRQRLLKLSIHYKRQMPKLKIRRNFVPPENIRRRMVYALKHGQSAAAKKFGVSQSLISLNLKYWKTFMKYAPRR